MYSCFRGEGERRVWKDEKGEEKKGVTGGKGRKFLKKLVGKGEGEGKGEKL